LNIDHDQEDPFHFLNYSVANYGKTPALVESASIGINVGVAPKQPDAVVGWHDFLVSPLFVTGERRDNPTTSVPDDIEIGDYADENTGPFPIPWLKGEDEFFSGSKSNTAALSVKTTKLPRAGGGTAAAIALFCTRSTTAKHNAAPACSAFAGRRSR
jgi:hypothetical protein